MELDPENRRLRTRREPGQAMCIDCRCSAVILVLLLASACKLTEEDVREWAADGRADKLLVLATKEPLQDGEESLGVLAIELGFERQLSAVTKPLERRLLDDGAYWRRVAVATAIAKAKHQVADIDGLVDLSVSLSSSVSALRTSVEKVLLVQEPEVVERSFLAEVSRMRRASDGLWSRLADYYWELGLRGRCMGLILKLRRERDSIAQARKRVVEDYETDTRYVDSLRWKATSSSSQLQFLLVKMFETGVYEIQFEDRGRLSRAILMGVDAALDRQAVYTRLVKRGGTWPVSLRSEFGGFVQNWPIFTLVSQTEFEQERLDRMISANLDAWKKDQEGSLRLLGDHSQEVEARIDEVLSEGIANDGPGPASKPCTETRTATTAGFQSMGVDSQSSRLQGSTNRMPKLLLGQLSASPLRTYLLRFFADETFQREHTKFPLRVSAGYMVEGNMRRDVRTVPASRYEPVSVEYTDELFLRVTSEDTSSFRLEIICECGIYEEYRFRRFSRGFFLIEMTRSTD